MDLAQDTEIWIKGALIQAPVCLKHPPDACIALSKTDSSPSRCSVLLSLCKTRAHVHADRGQLEQDGIPQRRAKCQAKGGKPDGEYKEHNCRHLPSGSTVAGGLWRQSCVSLHVGVVLVPSIGPMVPGVLGDGSQAECPGAATGSRYR